jgi:2-polyprenyl-6-methoxyphenol hydroxylase-like FAD-dependent oxidoreductase
MGKVTPKPIACCIAGCGPAGAVLGLLLARAGLAVLVLEKHGDFLRDFRGDTIHPSTLELMAQLGLVDKLLALPHSKVAEASLQVRGQDRLVLAEFNRLRTPYPYVMFVPQWNFLDLITSEARHLPNFQLLMNAEAQDLIEEDGTVRGLRYQTSTGSHDVLAQLTVAADGRWSRLREASGLHLKENQTSTDLFWFSLSRRPGDAQDLSIRLGDGRLAVLINRFDYWQVGYLFLKGTESQIRQAGLDAFKASMVGLVPELADRVDEIKGWDQLRHLEVRSNRLTRWHKPGFICIGDAAHAMSPVGGVGINVAIQDAVVTANQVVQPLAEDKLRDRHLRAIQLRRQIPVRATQAFQQAVQHFTLTPSLIHKADSLPLGVRLLRRYSCLRHLPARLIGIGLWRVRISPRVAARPQSKI